MCKYCLREIKRKDIEIINVWRNNKDLIDFLGAPYRYINEDVDYAWYDNYISQRKTTVRCAIIEEGNDEILGLVSLTDIDYLNQSAEFHIMIGDKANQGVGIGNFAVNMMVQHAFFNMNLQRVELSVLADNKRCQFGVAVFDFHRVLQLLFINKHYFIPPSWKFQGHGSLSQV